MSVLGEIREKEFEEDNNSGDVFTDFQVICKCGSKNVIIENDGGNGCYTCGEQGKILLKCKKCGNAYSAYC